MKKNLQDRKNNAIKKIKDNNKAIKVEEDDHKKKIY